MSSGSDSTSTASSSSSTGTSTASMMTMTFHTGISDSLWWSSWTPTTPVAYAFTFLALVALGITSRALHAYKATWERRIRVKNMKTSHIVVQSRNRVAEKVRESAADSVEVMKVPEPSVRSSNPSVAETERVRLINPWRLSVDVPRGLLHFLYSGVGYLLMLAVMTANVGYFFAVLTGLFLGEVLFGRYAFAPVVAPELVGSD